jgi:hypothetical protein
MATNIICLSAAINKCFKAPSSFAFSDQNINNYSYFVLLLASGSNKANYRWLPPFPDLGLVHLRLIWPNLPQL